MFSKLQLPIFIIISLLSVTSHAKMPDFYSEVASVSKRAGHSEAPNEVIDPFSGTLNIAHNDLVIPGNGGLDIRIQRVYSSQNVYTKRSNQTTLKQLQAKQLLGLGWSMHFGRIRMGLSDPCLGQSQSSVTNNPVVELQDGSQQQLFCNDFPSTYKTNAQFVAKDNGVAYYIDRRSRSKGFIYIDPNGIKYTMNFRVSGETGGTVTNYVWYATRIEDRNGNYLKIDYSSKSYQESVFPTRITSSDGRRVTFSYINSSNRYKTRLGSISYRGQTWRYSYAKVKDYMYQHETGEEYYFLTKVSLSGTNHGDWSYSYYNRSDGDAGDRLLKKVTYPHGATTTYDYKYHCFMYTNCTSGSRHNTLVVKSKINSGRHISTGEWRFSYQEADTYDTTTINGPTSKEIYTHFGLHHHELALLSSQSTFTNQNDNLWRVGLLVKKEIQNLSGTTLQTEEYDYSKRKISNEFYSRYPYSSRKTVSDPDVFVGYITEKRTIRDGKTYVTKYEKFNDNINPHKITEIGQTTRVKTLDYYPRRNGQNIVGQIKNEQYSSSTNRKITRRFDSKGNLISENKFGVLTRYSYDNRGNISRIQDARNKSTLYGRYYRGIARSETKPEGITITRTVDEYGNVTSVKNGRNFATSYSYDTLNRLTRVKFPFGSDTNINWSQFGRTLTRGGYTQNVTFDGFGRTICTKTENIYVGEKFNAAGNSIYQTYPNFSSCSFSSRTNYTYDALNRLRRTTHPDGHYSEITYQSNNIQRLRDERGQLFYNSYRSYSNPDQQELIKITGPNSLNLTIRRNVLGQVTSVNRNGVQRSYNYGSSIFLLSESNPETGTTFYGRDAVGNMLSKRTSNSPTTYHTYDDLNRLILTNYPGATPDITLSYDKNSNLKTVNSGLAKITYSYNPNDKLTKEQHNIDGKNYYLSYSYTNLDHLNSITYADGGIVNYTSNDLGWPTKASPYVRNIKYDAFGRPTEFTFANGRKQTQNYWTRGWPRRTIVDGGISDRERSYDASGNLTVVNDRLNNLYDRNMTYDGLNRLKTAHGAWGNGTINYSTDDDITSKKMGTNSLTYNYSSSNKISSVSGLQNFITPANYSYDVYGNITQKTNSSFGWTYTYDHASNLRQVRDKSNTLLRSYDYSGQKQRIKSTKPDETRIHIVSKSGQLMNEFVVSGAKPNIANVYIGNRLVAELESRSGPVTPSTIYGWGYGNSQNKYNYSRVFTLDKIPNKLKLCVKGYGINYSTEVSVKVNGTLIGYMKPGGDPTETCFDVPVSLLRVGNNTLLFTQASPGQTWGVGSIQIKPLSNTSFLPAVYLLLNDEEAN